jgi:hypothetical protein
MLYHGRHKPIAIPAAGLNHPLGVSTVTHCLPHGPQCTLQCGIGNELLWPRLRAQFVLVNDTIAMFQEIRQHLEDFWR